jgi:hypothetical protein
MVVDTTRGLHPAIGESLPTAPCPNLALKVTARPEAAAAPASRKAHAF